MMKLHFGNIRPENLERMMHYLQQKVNQDFEVVGAGHIEITNVQSCGFDKHNACWISCELNDCVQSLQGENPSDLAMQCFTTFFDGTYLVLRVPETGFECYFA